MKKIFPLAALLALFCTRLEVPELASPADGETLLTATPEFIWHPASNARSYSVEISAEESFAETIDSIVFKDTSFILADTLKLGQEYHWRVTARNLQGVESAPSEPETFRVQEGVELLTPAESDSTAWPEFSWESFPGASSYNFVLSSYADFREPFFDTTTGSTSLQWPDSLAPATYFWRVQALSASRPVAPWSVVRRLVSYRIADTYFPLYMGRRQTFERITGRGSYNIYTHEIDTLEWSVNTLDIKIDNSYTKDGELYWVFSDTLWDVGSEVSVRRDSLFSPVFFLGELYPSDSSDFRTWSDTVFKAVWLAETLRIYFEKGDSGRSYFKHIQILHLPVQGVIEQHYRLEDIASDSIHSWLLDHMRIIP